MRRKCIWIGFLLLLPTGCSSKKDSPTPPTGPEVRFLIGANGLIDQALLEGRLSALVLPEQAGSEMTVTKLASSDALNPGENPFGFKPGTYRSYTFPVTIGEMQFADAGILLENPLPGKGPFKLSNIKSVGTLELSGMSKDSEVNGASQRVFSATVEASWKGPAENKAEAKP